MGALVFADGAMQKQAYRGDRGLVRDWNRERRGGEGRGRGGERERRGEE